MAQLIEIGQSVRMWLLQDTGFDEVMAELRALNPLFIVFAPKIQAGFTTRLKSEQATMRKLVIRMDTMRRTSYVSAGYLIAEVTALVIFVLLLITEIGEIAPTVLVVGVMSYLLFYVLALIRDLDNPFEYRDGKPSAADVHLDVLEHSEDRLRGLLATMGRRLSDDTGTARCRSSDASVVVGGSVQRAGGLANGGLGPALGYVQSERESRARHGARELSPHMWRSDS